MLDVIAIAWLFVAANGAAAESGEIGLTPDCPTRCGDVVVPYPFGIREGCYLPGFNLTCDLTGGGGAPRLLIGDGDGTMQVTNISLAEGTVRVNTPGAIRITYADANRTDGRGTWRGLVDGGPYYVAKFQNQFVLSGCNVVSELVSGGGGGGSIGGCSSFCPLNISYDNGSCTGIGCCQMRIPMGRAYYGVRLRQLQGSAVSANNARMPIAVFIAEKAWLERSYSQLWRMMAPTTVPVILRWAVGGVTWRTSAQSLMPPSKNTNVTCSAVDTFCRSTYSYCENRTNYYLSGHVCKCQQGYDGNPYLTDGCQDINECEHPDVYKCFGSCINMPGTYQCRCPRRTHGNPYIADGCIRSSVGVNIAIGVGSSVGLLFFILVVTFLTRKLKVRRQKELRLKYFKQNRGQLLQQRAGIAEGMIITLEELEKATNNFDKVRELGSGGHGTVYKGILSNLHVVAIKRSNIVVKKEINDFINEVIILSQINHRNVVKLFGCCLETEVPVLVYEFISNGTLYHHLHVQGTRSIRWDDRLRIATETARALAYLHSAVSIPIIHRDIKSSNILLNDTWTTKVSDFGASRCIPIDQTEETTGVQGTLGYMDPMYYYTRRLTEKSDVYSFGVILIELLTRKKPSSYQSTKGDSLVAHFIALLREDNIVDLLDKQVMEEGDANVNDVAALAAVCVKLRGEDRPSMRQVEMTLEALQTPKKEYILHDNVVQDNRTEENHVYLNDHLVEVGDMSVPSTVSRRYSLEEEFMWSAKYPR